MGYGQEEPEELEELEEPYNPSLAVGLACAGVAAVLMWSLATAIANGSRR